jgi:hypothetical protein
MRSPHGYGRADLKRLRLAGGANDLPSEENKGTLGIDS